MKRRPVLGLSTVALVFGIIGCGAQRQGPAGSDGGVGSAPNNSDMAAETVGDPAQDAPPVDEQAVSETYRGIIVDYEPVSIDELARKAHLIVTGNIAGFTQGTLLYAEEATDPRGVPTMVMAVEVMTALKGTPPTDGMVYVLQARPAGLPLGALDNVMPAGTRVGLYLQSVDWSTEDIVGDRGAGRPEGALLWAAGPQSFVVADGENGGVILPYLQEEAPDTALAEALP